MEKSESIKNITTSLIKFDGLIASIPKTAKNPFYNSKYAKLENIQEAIRQPLIDCGLTVKHFPEANYGLTTIVAHESGEYMLATYFMIPTKNSPQEAGALISYQKRYALGAVLGLCIDEDEDGNKSSAVIDQDPDANTYGKTPKASLDTEDIAKAVKEVEEAMNISDLKTLRVRFESQPQLVSGRISKKGAIVFKDALQQAFIKQNEKVTGGVKV